MTSRSRGGRMKLATFATAAAVGCADPVLPDREDPDFGLLPPPASCRPGEVARLGRRGFVHVQDALDSAPLGGTLTLCAGVHPVLTTLTYSGIGPLRVVGETGSAADVVLDGNLSGLILRLADGSAKIRIEDVTFTRGGGAGVATAAAIDGVPGSGRVDLISCVFVDNVAEHSGVVNLQAITNRIVDSEFVDNLGNTGASSLVVSTSGATDQFILIDRSTFRGNFGASGTAFVFSGSMGTKSVVRVINSTFEDNINTGGLGVLEVQATAYPNFLVVESSEFIRNRSISNVPSLFAFSRDGQMTVGVRDTMFQENYATNDAAMVLDGWPCLTPFCVNGNQAIIEDSSFVMNSPRRGSSFRGADHWLTEWRNVDFGTGPTNNIGTDIYNCQLDLGANTNGVTHGAVRDWCP